MLLYTYINPSCRSVFIKNKHLIFLNSKDDKTNLSLAGQNVKQITLDSNRFFLNKLTTLKSFFRSAASLSNYRVYFSELELIGLGYRLSFKNNTVRLNLGFSHIIFVSLPSSVFLLKRKAKILLYSFDSFELSTFVSKLLRFKKLNVYKLKGLKRKSDTFNLKPGKRTK